jgi:rsbT co-antagonist protein RsbR
MSVAAPGSNQEERIERIISVLAMVSVGEFDRSKIGIEVHGEDTLALLEQTINVFTEELDGARREQALAMQLAESSRREIEEKMRTIARQRDEIMQLSTPIIELWDDVITLPIIGAIDGERSLEMTERLLYRIVQLKARYVIIDLTGVDTVDTMTADHLMKMINAAKHVGAHCSITGISPDVAQTLVRLDVQLNATQTHRSLKEGLREAFERMYVASKHGSPGRNL